MRRYWTNAIGKSIWTERTDRPPHFIISGRLHRLKGKKKTSLKESPVAELPGLLISTLHAGIVDPDYLALD